MKKAEMVERLKRLQEILNMDAKDVAERYNAEHKDVGYKFDTCDAYPYMVGMAQYQINYILSH